MKCNSTYKVTPIGISGIPISKYHKVLVILQVYILFNVQCASHIINVDALSLMHFTASIIIANCEVQPLT